MAGKNIEKEDLFHVLRMVLNENRGNVLTEALGLGIEQAVMFYLSRLGTEKTLEAPDLNQQWGEQDAGINTVNENSSEELR